MIDYKKYIEMIIDALEYSTLVDENANIIYISQKYAHALGYTSQELVGIPIKEVCPNTRIPAIMQSREKSLGEYYLLENNIPVFANRFPLFQNGKLSGLFGSTVIYNLDDVVQLNSMVSELKQENITLKEELLLMRQQSNATNEIIGDSPAIMNIRHLLDEFSNTNLNVLIVGESGTGKEIYADALHYMSNRNANPYVKINCAAIHEELLDSELFGYSGASDTTKFAKIGKFEEANTGTILLDEISEMPMHLQIKLLRILRTKEIMTEGNRDSIKLDIRFIFSTNSDLEECVRQGTFRKDLYYEISTVTINVPPLRQHIEDLPALCEAFIRKINRKNGFLISGINDAAIALFREYNWDGNIRELIQALERACTSVSAGELQLKDFDFLVGRIFPSATSPVYDAKDVLSLSEKRARAEKEEIIKALVLTNGKRTEASKLLEIDRTILYSKMKKYDIKL